MSIYHSREEHVDIPLRGEPTIYHSRGEPTIYHSRKEPTIYHSRAEHIDIPLSRRTRRYTTLEDNTSIYHSPEEHVDIPLSRRTHDIPLSRRTRRYTTLEKNPRYTTLEENTSIYHSRGEHYTTDAVHLLLVKCSREIETHRLITGIIIVSIICDSWKEARD